MKRRVAIVGSGEHGVVSLHILRAAGLEPVGFLDDDPIRHGTPVAGLLLLGDTSWFSTSKAEGVSAFIAIGDNTARRKVAGLLRQRGIRVLNAVHPTAVLMDGVQLGSGVFVGPGVVIVSGTRVCDDVIVNTAATVDHDGVLLSAAHIAPGVHTGGKVTIGEESLIGVGASLSAGITVGSKSVVGAGSVVLDDVPSGVVVAGVPARFLRTLEDPIDWSHILRPDHKARVRPG